MLWHGDDDFKSHAQIRTMRAGGGGGVLLRGALVLALVLIQLAGDNAAVANFVLLRVALDVIWNEVLEEEARVERVAPNDHVVDIILVGKLERPLGELLKASETLRYGRRVH